MVTVLMLNPCVDISIEVEDLVFGKTNRAKAEEKQLGGKGINVSKVLKSLGVDVTLLGFVGRDISSTYDEVLKDCEIKNELISIDGITRTNIKLFSDKEKKITEINGIGFEITESDINALNKKLDDVLKKTDILVLSGSIPKGVPASFYAETIKKAKDKGIKTVLDASGEALRFAVREKPYFVKPNIEELCELFDEEIKESEVNKYAQRLIDSGINIVVISMGEKGAVFASEKECLFAENIKVDVKSTVGAGDSMVASTVYAIEKGFSLLDVAKYGISAGCITCSKNGTNLARGEEITLFKNNVKIRQV